MELTENQTIGDRIKYYLTYKNITDKDFESKIKASNGFLANTIKNKSSIGSEKIKAILKVFKDINPIWLIMGEGDMILIENKQYIENNNLLKEEDSTYIINRVAQNSDINYEKIIEQLKKELAEKEYIIQLQKQLLELKK